MRVREDAVFAIGGECINRNDTRNAIFYYDNQSLPIMALPMRLFISWRNIRDRYESASFRLLCLGQ